MVLIPPSTARLVFREWEPDHDAEAAYKIYGDTMVTQFLGTGRCIESLAAQRTALLNAINPGDGTGRWAALLDGEPIGAGIFKELPDANMNGTGEFEIGWHLRRDHWGHGLGTEIGMAMREHARNKCSRILAIAYPQNTASLRIMEKIGMRPLGLTNRFYGVECMAYEFLFSGNGDHAAPNG